MEERKQRYYWIDATKAIGIFLVFYGHVLQQTYHLSTDEVFAQYRLIFSFHMPLFFFVSGFFYKPKTNTSLKEIGVLFQKRILPVLLFSGISLLIWPLYLYLKFGKINYQFILSMLQPYLVGQPNLNATLWFLVCLFTVELWAFFLLPKVKTVLQGILIASFFMLLGHSMRLRMGIDLILPRNFWYIHESILAFGLYTAGYATFGWLKKLVKIRPITRVLLLIIFASLTIWAVKLNVPYQDFVMTMKASEHGNLYFFVSAFSGILVVILLSSFLPYVKWVSYVGRNTLILLGTNGLFMSFFNSHLIGWLDHYDSTSWILFDSAWISLLTIGLSVPVIEILNKWLPQLIGRVHVDGPILKALPLPEFGLFARVYKKFSEKLGNISE